mmetsp:Transcript_32568/g.49089  ORF Transcript_32568/g.49089 Transcript_32568/m.49089 type:complete len:139 (-) Transcript_32568:414-830(-)
MRKQKSNNDQRRNVSFSKDVDVILVDTDDSSSNRWYSRHEIPKMRKERLDLAMNYDSIASINYQSMSERKRHQSQPLYRYTDLLTSAEIFTKRKEGRTTAYKVPLFKQQRQSSQDKNHPIDLSCAEKQDELMFLDFLG